MCTVCMYPKFVGSRVDVEGPHVEQGYIRSILEGTFYHVFDTIVESHYHVAMIRTGLDVHTITRDSCFPATVITRNL